MKILFLDLLSPAGHLHLNRDLLEILTSLGSVDVACREGYLCAGFLPQNVGVLYGVPGEYYRFSGRLNTRLNCIRAITWVLRNIELRRYDIIFVSSYETVSFSLAWPSDIGPRVVLLNHNNLDELGNWAKGFAFRMIPTQIEHVVFEASFSDYLKADFGIRNRVWIMRHPIDQTIASEYRNAIAVEGSSDDARPLVFAPSSSNDEDFICYLIEMDEAHYLSELGVRFLVKSRRFSWTSSQLHVTTQPFSRGQYVRLMGDAALGLLPYPPSYRYRASGVLFDFLALKKRFIGPSLPLFEQYVRKYPGIGLTYTDIRVSMDVLRSVLQERCPDAAFAMVREDHSFEAVREDLENIVRGAGAHGAK